MFEFTEEDKFLTFTIAGASESQQHGSPAPGKLWKTGGA
jgi:hypothetical protein